MGQVVVIGVGNIGELSGLGGQPHGIGAATPGIPAAWRRAGHLFMEPYRLGYGSAFLVLGHVLVFDPFQAVTCDFPIRLLHRRYLLGAAGESRGDAVDRERNARAGEEAMHSPEPGARAVVVDRLHVPVTLPGPGGGTWDVRQERL